MLDGSWKSRGSERCVRLGSTDTSLPELVGVYYPGGSRPVCSEQTALDMVRAGWLVCRGDRFEITPEGLRVLESQSPNRPDEGQAQSRASAP